MRGYFASPTPSDSFEAFISNVFMEIYHNANYRRNGFGTFAEENYDYRKGMVNCPKTPSRVGLGLHARAASHWLRFAGLSWT